MVEGLKILVTGASSGLGRHMAQHLAGRGARVAAAARRAEALEALAAARSGSRALETTEADWTHVLDVNLSGVFRTAQAGARAMAETGGGAILATASILGFGVQKGVAGYAASKAGVVHLVRALALEWGRHGIRVNAIAPGFFPTEMTAGYLASDAARAMLPAIPLGRFGEPSDLDGAVELLIGPAGRYITGVTIPVDGGHLCRSL